MKHRLLGIDCATEDAKIGVAYGELTTNGLAVYEARQCSRENSVIETTISWLAQDNFPTLLAIDAPLGWPVALSVSLVKHLAGDEIATEPNTMFRRCTDHFIQEKIGKTPLDVGADRIARTAHSALTLLGALRRRLRCEIPLAWSLDDCARISAIEVYPAATLRAHSINASGYKKKSNLAERDAIIEHLRSHTSFPENIEAIRESSDALDAVVCLVAGGDFLRGLAMPPADLALAKQEGWIWVCSMA